MTCGACAARIERRLNLLDGVEARVNFASERATAVFPVDVPVERLIAEVAAAGYRAELPAPATATDGTEGARFSDTVKLDFARQEEVDALRKQPLH